MGLDMLRGMPAKDRSRLLASASRVWLDGAEPLTHTVRALLEEIQKQASGYAPQGAAEKEAAVSRVLLEAMFDAVLEGKDIEQVRDRVMRRMMRNADGPPLFGPPVSGLEEAARLTKTDPAQRHELRVGEPGNQAVAVLHVRRFRDLTAFVWLDATRGARPHREEQWFALHEFVDLAHDSEPFAQFQAFLEVYGVPFRDPQTNKRVRFAGRVLLDIPHSRRAAVISREVFRSLQVKGSPKLADAEIQSASWLRLIGPGRVELVRVFFVNMTRYKADLRNRGYLPQED